jgi:hypothetical protein
MHGMLLSLHDTNYGVQITVYGVSLQFALSGTAPHTVICRKQV